MLRKAIALAAALGLACAASQAQAATHPKTPKKVDWSFTGPFGTFDQAQLQRGFKVYQEVCAACHSMSLLSYRNLAQEHGPFWDPKYPNPIDSPYAKAIAAEVMVSDIDSETGDVIERPATPADRFRAPFPNEAAARASNGGAFPPDLSVITKARSGGPNYIYSLLTGYENPPAGLTVPAGQYYNAYMPGDLSSFWTGQGHAPPGGFLAMPFQLPADRVTYDDGTRATPDQMAKDVTAFLAWAADPNQTARKKMGFAAIIYLLVLAGIVYASYRRVWARVHHGADDQRPYDYSTKAP